MRARPLARSADVQQLFDPNCARVGGCAFNARCDFELLGGGW